MARPSKLTAEITEKLRRAIQLGATYEHACNYAGVSYRAFRYWMEKGEGANRGKFFQFFQDIKGSEGKATIGWLAKIEMAANDGTWQAAAWKLERRYPDEYGRQVRKVEHSGPDGGPVQTVGYTVEEWRDEQDRRLTEVQEMMTGFEDAEDAKD